MASLVSESLAGTRIAKTYGLEGLSQGRARAPDLRRCPPAQDEGRQCPRAARSAARGRRRLRGRRRADADRLAHPRRATSTVGDFTGFVSALILAAQPIRALGNLNAIVQEAAAALQRYFAVMDEAPRDHGHGPGARPLARRRRRDPLRERPLPLHGDAPALDGVDLVGRRRAGPRPWSAARARASRRCCPSCRGSTT